MKEPITCNQLPTKRISSPFSIRLFIIKIFPIATVKDQNDISPLPKMPRVLKLESSEIYAP